MSGHIFRPIHCCLSYCVLLVGLTGCDASRPSELRATGPTKAVSSDTQDPVQVTIQNVGTTPFHILTLESSCGCTIVDGDIPAEVPARSAVQIPLKVSTSFWGTKQVNVTVTTDAELIPVQVVSFSVNGLHIVAPYAAQNDYRFQVNVPSASVPASATFSIRTIEDKGTDLWLKGLTSTAKNVSVTVQKAGEHPVGNALVERQYDVSFLIPDMRDSPGGRDFHLIPELSCPAARDDVRVMVSVKVTPPLEALPARLTFRDDMEPVSVQRLLLATVDEEQVELSEQESLPEGVSVSPVATGSVDSTPGTLFDVTVDWGILNRSNETAVLSFATSAGHTTTVPIRLMRPALP